jgi:hypothetical protein
MSKMKQLFTDLQEAQQAFNKNQLFPLNEEERANLFNTVHALVEPRKRGNGPGPREDQTSFIG